MNCLIVGKLENWEISLIFIVEKDLKKYQKIKNEILKYLLYEQQKLCDL
jgi:hypothetical protein